MISQAKSVVKKCICGSTRNCENIQKILLKKSIWKEKFFLHDETTRRTRPCVHILLLHLDEAELENLYISRWNKYRFLFKRCARLSRVSELVRTFFDPCNWLNKNACSGGKVIFWNISQTISTLHLIAWYFLISSIFL